MAREAAVDIVAGHLLAGTDRVATAPADIACSARDHGGHYDRPIQIAATMEPDGRTLVVRMRDWGCGVDPTCLPCRPHDPLQPGGIGMICLRQWMDDITFTPQPDGGVLTILKRRKKA